MARDIAVGPDSKLRALWTNTDGRASMWVVSANGALEFNQSFGPYAGWKARAIAVGADGKIRALWTNTDRRASLWVVGAAGNLEVNQTFGPF